MNGFNNVDSIATYLKSIKHTKYDTTLPMSSINALPLDGDIGLDVKSPMERLWGDSSDALPMNRSAFRNLFTRMGVAKGWAFFRDNVSPNHPVEGARLLNEMLHNEIFNTNKRGMKQVFVRSRGDIQEIEEGGIHRAIFSDQYTVLDMLDIVTVVQKAVNQFSDMKNVDELMGYMRKQYGTDVSIVNSGNNGGGIGHKLERVNVGPDNMSFRIKLNMVFSTEELGNFNTGLFVRADEIGLTSIHILPYIWREICKNGLIGSYERTEVTQMRREQGWSPILPHRWGSTEDLTYQATQATAFAFAYGTQLVAQARAAAYRAVPNASDILGRMLEAIIPKEQLQQASITAGTYTEGESTVAGVVNGITGAAHTEGLNPIVIDELESTGGTALRQFDNEMSDKEIQSLFLRLSKAELIMSEENA